MTDAPPKMALFQGVMACFLVVWVCEFISGSVKVTTLMDDLTNTWGTILSLAQAWCPQWLKAFTVTTMEHSLHNITTVPLGVVVGLLADASFDHLFVGTLHDSCIVILFSTTFLSTYIHVAAHFKDRVVVAYSDCSHDRLNQFLHNSPDCAVPALIWIRNQQHFTPVIERLNLELFDNDLQTLTATVGTIERLLLGAPTRATPIILPDTYTAADAMLHQPAAVLSAMGAHRTVIDDFITARDCAALVSLIKDVSPTTFYNVFQLPSKPHFLSGWNRA